jgi:hypothetical protein
MSSWDVALFWRQQRLTAATGETAAQWTLFPLIHFERAPGSRISFVLPYLSMHRGAEGMAEHSLWGIIPLVFRERESAPGHEMKRSWVAPIYRHTLDREPVDGQGESSTVRDWGLFPLTWGWTDGEFDHLNLLYPLFSWKPTESLWITPLLWWGEDYLIFGPLWGRWKGTRTPPPEIDPEGVPLHLTEWHLLFPLYLQTTQRRGEGELHREHTVLWPLVMWGDGGGRTEHRIFPLWRRALSTRGPVEKRSLWALWPIYMHGRSRAGDDLFAAHDVLLPLFADVRWTTFAVRPGDQEPVPQRRDKRLRAVFPLWVEYSVNGHIRDLAIAGPLFRRHWAPPPAEGEVQAHSWRFGLLLTGFKRLANGHSGFDVLGPVFTRERRGPAIRKSTFVLLTATDRDPGVHTRG